MGLGGVLVLASLGPGGLLRLVPIALTLFFTFIGVALWKGAQRYDILARKEEEGERVLDEDIEMVIVRVQRKLWRIHRSYLREIRDYITVKVLHVDC